jgi:RNA polymerase sigma factor (sigma-70 family)
MFNICMRMCRSREDAEDLLQESFVLAFRNLRQLKEPANFGGWLKRIVINECIRYTKKTIRWLELEDSHYQIPYDEEDRWFSDIPASRINEEIKKLPDACRAVFNLYAVEDLSHRDIAAALGISESTSKSQYHRARHLLKERIVKIELPKTHG